LEKTGVGNGRPATTAAPPINLDLLDLVFDAILTRRLADRVVTRWNAGCEELYGWTAEEAVGRPLDELLGTRPEVRSQVDQELARHGRWEGELTQRYRDEREGVVSARCLLQPASGADGATVVEVHRDVTGQARSQERLKEADESLRILLAGVRDYAIFMLDPGGRVMTWNEGAQRIKGYTSEEIIGKHYSVFFEPSEVQSGKPDWELVVAEREGRFEEEGWRIRKDGTRFWANVVLTALRDANGRLAGFGKVSRDITDRRLFEERRAEEQRRKAEQLQQHAERMAQLEKVKRDFLNLASHELRGPLSVLRGYMSMIEDGTLSVDRFPEFVPLLSAKLRQIELLVTQMLDTARLESGRLALRGETFDLGAMVAQIIESFRPLASDRHKLELVAPDRLVMVTADRERLETVVSNLVDNAIKYSPHGGPVTCLVAATASRAFVSVRDQGLGIAREDVPKLFTPFGRIVTADNAHISGTGLGLYLAREVLQQQGGDILVESTLDRGSRFTVTLPLQPPRPRRPPRGRQPG
jgi:PAS domain S-box-containing protein